MAEKYIFNNTFLVDCTNIIIYFEAVLSENREEDLMNYFK